MDIAENNNGAAPDRRSFLKGSAAVLGSGLIIAGGSSVLSACGTSTSAGGGKPRSGGTLNLAFGGASQTDSLDAMVTASVWGIGLGYQIYNRLLDWKPPANGALGFELVPSLAEDISYSTNTKLVITLRKDVEFTNGKHFNADDVIFSIRRQVNPKVGGYAGVLLGNVDVKNIKKRDDYTVEVPLTKPDTFVKSAFASNYMAMYPTNWDPKHPVGTGPWKIKSFTPGDSAAFVKNDSHFAGAPHADQLVWQNYKDDSALVSALSSGAVNLLGSVPASQIRTLQAGGSKILRTKTGSCFAQVSMDMTQAPFRDARVRKAFQLMVDREAVVSQVYNGEATIGNDLINPFDPTYPTDVPQIAHDPEQAKSLLAAAGFSNLKIKLAVGGFAPNFEVVLAEAASAAGVTINVEQVDQSTWYAEHWLKDAMQTTGTYTRPFHEFAALEILPQGAWPATRDTNPIVPKLYNEAASTLDEAKQKDLLTQLQIEQHEQGGYISAAYLNQVDAVSGNVSGATQDISGRPFGSFNFKDMWLNS